MQNIHISSNNGKVVHLSFHIVTEVGEDECKVIIGDDHDKDDRPKAFATQYHVLGLRITHNVPASKIEKEGIRRLSAAFMDVCDNNGWNAWSY